MVIILVTYQRFATVPIFPLVYLQPDGLSRFEVSTSVFKGKLEAVCFLRLRKSFVLAAFGQIMIDYEVALPLPAFPDVSEKAWLRQLPLNKKKFTLRAARLHFFVR